MTGSPAGAAGNDHPTEPGWCAHCDADPAAYDDGLCRPCAAYRRKYDRLPGDDVLVQRQRRRDTQGKQRSIANRPHPAELAMLGEIGRLRQRLEREPVHPIEGLVEACNDAAINVAMLRHIANARDSLLGFNRHGEEVIHPITALYGEWLDRWGRLQKQALDANIDQQRLNIAEETTRANLTRFQRALSDAGLSPTQQEAVNDALSRQVASPLD